MSSVVKLRQPFTQQLYYSSRVFLKENVRYAVWTCRDQVFLILGTRFSLIPGTRFSILGTRIGSLKHL